LSFPEQGHGDEESGCLVGGESGVGQCQLCQTGELGGEMDLAKVFEIVDQTPTFSLAVQGGTGKFKAERKVMAIRANEGVRKLAVVALPTLLAEWGFDGAELVDAAATEASAMGEGALADLAGRWVEEIEQSGA